MLVAFFMMPFVIKGLGNSGYGFWAMLQSLTAYMFLLDLGVRVSLSRHLAKYFTENNDLEAERVFNVGMATYLVVGFLGIVASGIFALSFHALFDMPELSAHIAFWTILMLGSSVALHFPIAVFDAVLTAHQRFDLKAVSSIVSVLVRTALIILGLNMGHGLIVIAGASLFAALLYLAMAYGFAAFVYPAMRLNFSVINIATVKKIGVHGFYAYIQIGGMRVITDIGVVIIGAVLGAVPVTFYAIAMSLTTYTRQLVLGFSQPISPAASRLEAKGDFQGIRALCMTGTKYVLMVALPILATFILTGDEFILLWIGEGFEASYVPLILLSIAWGFSFLHTPTNQILLGISRHKTVAWLVLVQAVATLTLSLVLVRSYGIIGVALGLLIPSVVIHLIIQIHALRLLEIPLLKFLSNAIAPACVTVIPFIILLKLLVVTLAPSGLVGYFLMIGVAVAGMLVFLPWAGLTRDERDMMVEYVSRRWNARVGVSVP